ncbi:MAG: type II and III secretion system protein family protein [Methylohalobius sp. ZOD2]
MSGFVPAAIFCRSILTLFLLLAAALANAGETNLPVISIESGKQLSYAYEHPIKQVAIGDPKVAEVQVTGKSRMLITAITPGSTSLLLWHNDGDGEPDLTAEVRVTESISLKRHALERLAPSALEVTEAGDKRMLSGESRSLPTHDQARQALGLSHASEEAPTIDATYPGFDNQVQIDIKIVEVSRQRLQNAGLFLSKNSANATLALSNPGNLSGIESAADGAFSLLSSGGFLPQAQAFNFAYGNAKQGILGVISVLENNGFAYTLAEPSLVAISGQSASFLAGGEFPIPVQAGGSVAGAITVRFKEFGVRLSLTPTVLDRNRIALKVAPEVSELDFNAGIESGGVSVPALRVRRTDTTISLGDGESFVISGLVNRNTLASVDKIPWLGDIPILGAFFRSTRIDRNDKELIMVVTPHLVRPLAKEAPRPPLPGERFRAYDPDFFETFFQETGDFFDNPPATGFSR